MNNNLSIRPYQPAFKANLDQRFLNAAENFYKNGHSTKNYKQFCSAMRRFNEVPNSDHITIKYTKGHKDGKQTHTLYACQEGGKPDILLAQKDAFRKLIDKFCYMNEYEFKVKTGLIQKK